MRMLQAQHVSNQTGLGSCQLYWLLPAAYVHCGLQDVADDKKASMLVVSEFVGCSPSLSGAIRVNPWNVDSVADGIYAAIKMPLEHRHLRHVKHWRYVSSHTAAFWVKVRCCPG